MDRVQFNHDTVRLMGVHVLAVYMLMACAEQEGLVPISRLWILDHMPDKTSPNTITAALRWLTSSERQIAVRVTGGWRLNKKNAFQLPLTYELDAESSWSESAQSALLENKIGEETLKKSPSDFLEPEKRAERASCPLKKERVFKQDSEEDSFFLNDDEKRAERAFEEPALDLEQGLPGVKEILAETGDLFGGPAVYASGLDMVQLQPGDVFAWLAHAWDQWPEGGKKGRLHSPVQFVYKKLSADPFAPPSQEYQAGWKYILPDDWLERFGLVEYQCETCGEIRKLRCEYERHMETHATCEICEETFLDQEQLDEHMKTHRSVQKSESVTQRIDGRMSAEQAWQSVLGQLQMEMPRASFDTWVRDTTPVDFDGATLSVGVRNAYARDWLENRLASTVSRLLVGIMNARVDVNFVIDESEGE